MGSWVLHSPALGWYNCSFGHTLHALYLYFTNQSITSVKYSGICQEGEGFIVTGFHVTGRIYIHSPMLLRLSPSSSSSSSLLLMLLLWLLLLLLLKYLQNKSLGKQFLFSLSRKAWMLHVSYNNDHHRYLEQSCDYSSLLRLRSSSGRVHTSYRINIKLRSFLAGKKHCSELLAALRSKEVLHQSGGRPRCHFFSSLVKDTGWDSQKYSVLAQLRCTAASGEKKPLASMKLRDLGKHKCDNNGAANNTDMGPNLA